MAMLLYSHELWLCHAKETWAVCFASSPHGMDPSVLLPSPLETSGGLTALSLECLLKHIRPKHESRLNWFKYFAINHIYRGI